MSKRSFISISALVMLLAFSSLTRFAQQKAWAQQKGLKNAPEATNTKSQSPSTAGKKARKPAKKGPIIITSDTLSADQTTHTAIFEGRVAARQNGMELFADKMVVHYNESGGVKTIDATGSVKLIKGGRVVTSGRAHYDKATDSILFTENPKIAQAKTVVTGTAITYYVSTDKMNVKNSKVFIEGK